MAVFTELSTVQLEELLKHYFSTFGVSRFEGISAGIENTNYFVDLKLASGSSSWVLTILEMPDLANLNDIVHLTQHLAAAGLPVPAALNDRLGNPIQQVVGKSTVLVPRAKGAQVDIPSEDQCRQVGALLAQMHLAAKSAGGYRAVVRDQTWLWSNLKKLSMLPNEQFRHLEREVQVQADLQSEYAQCPQGWIHGDLFVDNVLFQGDEISGVIDFYHACHDYWLLDLAILCNDWCYREPKGYVAELLSAVLTSYQSIRPLESVEKKLWPFALRLGALRFWMSRLLSMHTAGYQRNVKHGDVLKPPEEMQRKINAAIKIPAL